MKLYVIRHGQTNWNLKGIIQGQKDIELNDEGINEARKAKRSSAMIDKAYLEITNVCNLRCSFCHI